MLCPPSRRQLPIITPAGTTTAMPAMTDPAAGPLEPTARRRARTRPRTAGPHAKTRPPWRTRPAVPPEERNKGPAGPPRTGPAPRPPSPPGRISPLPGRGPASTGPARTTQAETALAAATTTPSRRPAAYARSPHCAASPAATRKPADHRRDLPTQFRVLRPVRAITATARAISVTNLHERLTLTGPDDEFKELAATLNDLLARPAAHGAPHHLRVPGRARSRLPAGLTPRRPLAGGRRATWPGRAADRSRNRRAAADRCGNRTQRIAHELVATLDTAKKHVSHVLGKFRAANRTEAVTRARELGVIPSHPTRLPPRRPGAGCRLRKIPPACALWSDARAGCPLVVSSKKPAQQTGRVSRSHCPRRRAEELTDREANPHPQAEDCAQAPLARGPSRRPTGPRRSPRQGSAPAGDSSRPESRDDSGLPGQARLIQREPLGSRQTLKDLTCQ